MSIPRPSHASARTWPARRLAFTGAAALAVAAQLAWEFARGGIARHHLLNDPGLPALSNGWGMLLVPVLAWIVSGRAFPPGARGPQLRSAVLMRLGGAALAGAVLSVAFATGASNVAGALFMAIVLAGIALGAYRVEYVLGFTLGMALTVGPVLPVLIGSLVALASAFVRLLMLPTLHRMGRALRA